MSQIRQPVVAGSFYPSDPQQLHQDIRTYLDEAESKDGVPKALIAPHAGYIYSGSVAGSVYNLLKSCHNTIRTVVLLGPSHRVGFRGLAVPSTEYFATPLGNVAVDQKKIADISDLSFVQTMDNAHALEHSLEVQIPFLQEVFDDFSIVPIVVGDAAPVEVAEVLERLWGGAETLIVVSSDLSHYHDYETAQKMDNATSAAIEQLDIGQIGYQSACGRIPINGLLTIANKFGLIVRTVDLRNSGDTAGSKDKVVGYGAYAFH